MQVDEAQTKHCLAGTGFCKGEKCMAWLLVNPKDDNEGVCMYLGLTTALMKILHLTGQMITAPKSPIVR